MRVRLLKFRDMLPDYPIDNIMVRTNYPSAFSDELSESEYLDGMLFGYCSWDGRDLVSLDGDTYSVDMEIEKYEVSDHGITVWFISDWI